MSRGVLDTQSELERAVHREGVTTDGTYRAGWLIFLFHAVLVFPVFFPTLGSINPWDEAICVDHGRRLAQGTWPWLSDHPLVALLYAITYLAFQSSPFWLVQSCGLGRLLLFGMCWLGVWLVAGKLSRVAPRMVTIAWLIVSPALTCLLTNGSHALFAALAAFALWQFLSFTENGAIRHLWLCSLFLGLGALCRSEAPVLFGAFLVLSLLWAGGWKRVGSVAVACLVPFTVLAGGYLLAYGVKTGEWNTGLPERSYFTFEQGHSLAHHRTNEPSEYVEGQIEAQRLFGDGEDNGYSVFRAIARNPTAYLERIPGLVKRAPWAIVEVYGRGLALITILFAMRGALHLAMTREWKLLMVLMAWACYYPLYVLLCFQPGHFLFAFVNVLALAAIGAWTALTRGADRAERLGWTGLLAALVLFTALRSATAYLLAASVLLLVGLWISWLAIQSRAERPAKLALGSLVILATCMVARGEFPRPALRHLGKEPEEKAMLVLREKLPSGAKVAAWAPGVVTAANLKHEEVHLLLRDLDSGEAVVRWLREREVRAVYEDRALRVNEPRLSAQCEGQVGRGLTVAHEDPGARLRIFLVEPPSQSEPQP